MYVLKWLYYNLFFTITITIYRLGHKPREVHKASVLLKWLSRFLGMSLKRHLSVEWNSNRIKQSKDTLRLLRAKKFVQTVDIKDCFPSSNILKFIDYYGPKLYWWEKKLLKFIFSSPVNGKIPKKITLRQGLSLSQIINGIILSDILDYVRKVDGLEMFIFVDDIIIFGTTQKQVRECVFKLKFHLHHFDLDLHPYNEKKISKNSGIIQLGKGSTKRRITRLGLHYSIALDGSVSTSLRPTTKRRYLIRIRKILNESSCLNQALYRISYVLYGERFGLFSSAFPRSIWTNDIDRKKMKCDITRVIKHRYKTSRNGYELFVSMRNIQFDKNNTKKGSILFEEDFGCLATSVQ